MPWPIDFDMKRFRFPLARLMRLRAHQERAARRSLADAVAEVARIENRMQGIDLDLGLLDAQDGLQRSGLALATALAEGLRRERRSLEPNLVIALQAMDRMRALYQQKRTDLEALSRLHTRRFEEWRTSLEHEAQAEMDQTAQVRFAARSREAR